MKVDYQVGFNEYQSEWVCPEHDGWARKKFEKWWAERSNDPVPDSADLAARIGKAGGIADAKSIIVRKVGGERFGRIVKHTLAEKPQPVSGYLEDGEQNEFADPFDSGFTADFDDVPF